MGRRSRRACAACGVPVARPARGTAARWCGACGAPLTRSAGAAAVGAGTPTPVTGTHGEAIPVAGTPVPASRTTKVAVIGVAALGFVAVTTAFASVSLERPTPAPAPSLDVDLGRDEIAAANADPPGDDGPVCLRDPACVVWVERASVAGRVPTATLAGDLTLVRVHDGLEARTTSDGRMRWHTPLLTTHGGLGSHLPVLTAGEVALVTADVDGDAALLGIDLRTGAPRWHVTGVTELEAAQDLGEVLLVKVERTDDAPAIGDLAASPSGQQVVAIDPTSGTVRWSASGDLLHLLDDGVVVVTGGEISSGEVTGGEVSVLDAAGARVWQRELDDGVDPAWLDVTGRFLRVYDAQGRSGQHLAVADGEPFEIEGELVPVADLLGEPRAPFRRDLAALVTRRSDGATDLALVDGDEITWRVTLAQLGCCAPIQLDDDRIVVPAADGGRWSLARDDGAVLDRAGPPQDPATATALPSYGGVTVDEADVATSRSDLVLVDDQQRTARLPAGSWPVGATDDIVVVRSPTWVAAIRRDADRDDD